MSCHAIDIFSIIIKIFIDYKFGYIYLENKITIDKSFVNEDEMPSGIYTFRSSRLVITILLSIICAETFCNKIYRIICKQLLVMAEN